VHFRNIIRRSLEVDSIGQIRRQAANERVRRNYQQQVSFLCRYVLGQYAQKKREELWMTQKAEELKSK